jgi:hypothetical protein
MNNSYRQPAAQQPKFQVPVTRGASQTPRTLNLWQWVLVAGTASLLTAGCATPANQGAQHINTPRVVEAACGQCLLGLKGKGCDLAVRIDGKSYFVDGVNLDALGDAHAKDGMCNVIRKAEVTGEIKGRRFAATSFKMVPAGQ